MSFSFQGGSAFPSFGAGQGNAVAVGQPGYCGVPIEVRWALGTPANAYVAIEDGLGNVLISETVAGSASLSYVTIVTPAANLTAALYTDSSRATQLARSMSFSVMRDPMLLPMTAPLYGAGVAQMNARDAVAGVGVTLGIGDGLTTDNLLNMLHAARIPRIRTPAYQYGASLQGPVVALSKAYKAAGFGVIGWHLLTIAYANDPATTWAAQQANLLALTAAGATISTIAGPNEVNGNACHGPLDTLNFAGSYDPATGIPAVISLWSSAFHQFKLANPGALANVRTSSASIAITALASYACLPNETAHVDFGLLHHYAGNAAQPDDNIAGIYNLTQGSFRRRQDLLKLQNPGQPIILEECGAPTCAWTSSPAGMVDANNNPVPAGSAVGAGAYEHTGHTQAQYLLNQLHEARRWGIVQSFIYNLYDGHPSSDYTEANYGLFKISSATLPAASFTAKPAVAALGAMQDVLSLGNSFYSAANLAEVNTLMANGSLAAFVPAFNPALLSVSGVASLPQADQQCTVVLHKSDGSTVISISHQPQIDGGAGSIVAPATETAALTWVLSYAWQVFDPMSATPTAAVSSGTGTGCSVPLKGSTQLVVLAAPSGYTAVGGDPRLTGATGRATFGGVQAVYDPSAVANGAPQSITVTPPSGTPWTPGNSVILLGLSNSYGTPTGPSGAMLEGFAGSGGGGNPSVTIYVAPVTVGTQTYTLGGFDNYARAFGYETSPYDSLTYVTGTATLNVSGNIITLNGIPDFSVAAGYRPGAHLIGAFIVGTGPSGNGGATGYVAGTSSGARIVAKAPATTNGNSSEQYRSGFVFDINQTGAALAAIFSTQGLISDTCLWAGVIANPKYAQPLASDVRSAAV